MKIIFHDSCFDLYTLFGAEMYLEYGSNSTFSRILNLSLNKISKISASPGKLIYINNDKYNNKVYILNRQKKKKIVCQAIMGLNRVFQIEEKVILYNLSNNRNIYLYISNLIRKIGLSKLLVNKLTFKGINQEYENILSEIKKFDKKIKEQLT